MTLEEIKKQALFQTGADQEDQADWEPSLTAFINEGYDRLLYAFCRMHVHDDSMFQPLNHSRAMPELPQWSHAAIADYASWRLCMSGPAARQARGAAFRASFEEAQGRLRRESGGAYLRGIPL